ncbi:MULTISPECIES: hypothetical protein [unclassified Corallococcus]|uniref:hypothetical protein n=1 Tax=unclassified Corallococcus TaxID=2685029 RepID=UPI001A8FCF7A|nr:MULTISPECIES: hypothetical protein [unclassified Corallococcus]MBN9683492.1 hypothetical protein [Corallococcus sp. NCSPR001]WAS84991.1 hypothetical protein O0N60_37755 [Corallococcus sp. NCRR]
MTSPLLTLPLLLCLGQAPEAIPTEAPFQARLSFYGTDEDIDAPESPAATSFHAALEGHTPELASGLRAEAALSFFLITGGSPGIGFSDNGSTIRVRYRPSGWEAGEGLSVGVHPMSTSRLYMGFTYPVTWERQAFPRRSAAESALELRLSRRRWDAFVALKSAPVLDDLELEVSRRYALLAGGFLDVTPEVRLAAKGTVLDRGQIPGVANLGIEMHVPVRGASLGAVWHRGAPIGNNVDLKLYTGDPTFFERFFQPETYPGGFAASVSLEGSIVSQGLHDRESDPPQRRTQTSGAGALEARVKQGFWRAHALAYVRSLGFIQVDVPGFPPYQDFLNDAETRAEVSGTLSSDYHLQDWGLTPGLLMRVTRPASLEAAPLGFPGSSYTAVFQGPNMLSLLPVGEDPKLVVTAKATLRWDLGPVAGVLAEVSYTHDPNRTLFESDDLGVARPVFQPANAVGVSVLLQARF